MVKFKNFLKCKSIEKLKKLSVDLSNLHIKTLINKERIRNYNIFSENLIFNYAFSRINDSVLSVFNEVEREMDLVSIMHSMQSGEVVNCIEGYPSENRKVLHTAMRSWINKPEENFSLEEERSQKEFKKLEEFLKEIKERGFTTLIQVGIGGSHLGPKVLFEALHHCKKDNKHVHFISNIDPDNVSRVINKINFNETLVLVVSKSGSTLETLTNEVWLRSLFSENNCDPSKHFVVVTEEKSPLDNSKNYLKVFYMWDYVGGRFSVTSIVGGMVLSFAFGIECYQEILKGAEAMDKMALNNKIVENIPLLFALISIWNRNFLHYPSIVISAYSEALSCFIQHIQQCDMESNGKQIDRLGKRLNFSSGPIIWGSQGTDCQHSFYQWLHQGTDIVPVEFIGFKENQYGKDFVFNETSSQDKLLANLFAQAIALAKGKENRKNPNRSFEGNRPSTILLAKKLTPYVLGSLLALYEHKVAFQGFCWGINSFDQEGVQLGKEQAKVILDLYSKKQEKNIKNDSYLEIENLLSLLKQF